jgi:MoxR-like ATPase
MKKERFPMIAEVKMAPGKGGKMVVKAFDSVSGEEVKGIVYVTLQGAYKAGMNLAKMSEDSSFTRVETTMTVDVLDRIISGAEVNVPKEAVVENEVMSFLKTCVEKRPETLYIEDLNWKFMCRTALRGGNMLMTGPTGCGKSQTAIAVAKALGRELFYVNLGATQDPRGTLIGNTHFSKEVGTFFNESAFVKAIQTPNTVILLDEISRAHPEAWNILMTVLDPGQRYLRLDEAVGAPTVHVAEGVSFIGTANIGSEYTAVRVMDRALLDRFTIAEIPYLTVAQESKLLTQLHPGLSKVICQNIAEIAGQTRAEVMTDSPRISSAISTRAAIEMAGLMSDGFAIEETAQVSIYPLYSNDGGMQSERTYVKQLVQKFINDGTADNLTGTEATESVEPSNVPF